MPERKKRFNAHEFSRVRNEGREEGVALGYKQSADFIREIALSAQVANVTIEQLLTDLGESDVTRSHALRIKEAVDLISKQVRGFNNAASVYLESSYRPERVE